MYSGDGYDQFGWAVFMAGGSLANIPVIEDSGFLKSVSGMQPIATSQKGLWKLNGKSGMVIYSQNNLSAEVDLTNTYGIWKACLINPRNGNVIKHWGIWGGSKQNIDLSGNGEVILWIGENNTKSFKDE